MKVFVTEEKLGGKPICMTWDERGRLWVAITIDYPNELQPRGPGPRPHRHLRGHQGRRRLRQGHRLRRQAQHPHQPAPFAGGVIVHQAPHTLFLKDTTGEGKAERAASAVHRLEHRRHPRRTEQPAVRARQLDLRHRSAMPASTARSAANTSNFRQGFYRFKVELNRDNGGEPAQGHQARVPPQHQQQHLGPGLQRGGRTLRQHRQRLSHRPHADPEPLLREGEGLDATGACRTSPPDNHIEPITDKIRQVDCHGGFTAGRQLLHLHGPHLSARILEPHRLRLRADRPPHRHVRADAQRHRLQGPLRLEPARQRRRMVRPDQGPGRPRRPRVGDRLVQLSSSSTTRRRPASRPARAAPTRPTCATRRTAASTASSTRRPNQNSRSP